MSALFAATAVAGVLLLLPRPCAAVPVAAALGAATVLWVTAWSMLLDPAGALLPTLARLAGGLPAQVAVNVGVAVTAWALAAGVLWVTISRLPRGGLGASASVIVAVLWAVGTILTGLGRDGAWPWESIAVAAVTVGLAAGLGLLARRAGGQQPEI
ncbi:hypothetical protein [Blastochloris sulfoviridis]|uniref:Uncharacterized protein n=1 Tax=Blastochloris sulfoviridis TaxID=50712 RepID=A0A5M6HQS1_9HYPH|nr:hypothetical protein [Blastochloris sulfoviridis]KAA5598222.1 hypothetical protein F1193_13625 [Blastochloris sulfoviridis]